VSPEHPLRRSRNWSSGSRNREEYVSGGYNEAQPRQDFLNPFFEALGWDIQNRQGYAEAYRDVIHEDSLEIGGTKAPDYCFRVGGLRKFFVEKGEALPK
jgi:predicted type IV restriction endonuclease